jgi:sugar transferase (PEP-CTERM/EpsH1 system associated)
MKLLFLAHRIPYPPNKGDKIRAYHWLRALAARGHEIHLLAFADDPRDLQYQVELARLCAEVHIVRLRPSWAKLRAAATVLAPRPLSLGYFASLKMWRLIKKSIAAHDYDAVFVYSSTMAQYVLRGLWPRTVVDLVDIDSEKWRDYAQRTKPPLTWLYQTEWQRLRHYEHGIVTRFAHTVVTTAREAALLDDLDEFTRRARLRTITNGVDLDYFQPNTTSNTSAPRLVFTGAMDYYANAEGVRWFVEEVWPLVRADEPQAEFFIVGSNPTSEVQQLRAHAGVQVTGSVPDVRPFLHSAATCVVPLRIARGVQNKVLEAMACAKAVVATPEAVAGLRVADGEQLLIADSPQEMANHVRAVLGDAELREQLGQRALRFIETEHEWAPLQKQLTDLLETISRRDAHAAPPSVRALAQH